MGEITVTDNRGRSVAMCDAAATLPRNLAINNKAQNGQPFATLRVERPNTFCIADMAWKARAT